jgi:hypothetical protein
LRLQVDLINAEHVDIVLHTGDGAEGLPYHWDGDGPDLPPFLHDSTDMEYSEDPYLAGPLLTDLLRLHAKHKYFVVGNHGAGQGAMHDHRLIVEPCARAVPCASCRLS